MSDQFIVPLFVAALFWGVLFGGICYYIAEEKGRDGGIWALLGAFGGLLALLVLAVIPSVPKRRSGSATYTQHCPQCATTTGAADRFCRACGAAVAA